ncbi:MAG: hypothetical protein ACK4GE_02135 [Caldimicrobium sp.]
MRELIPVKKRTKEVEIKLVVYIFGFMLFEIFLFYLGHMLQSEVISRVLIAFNLLGIYIFFGVLVLIGRIGIKRYEDVNKNVNKN